MTRLFAFLLLVSSLAHAENSARDYWQGTGLTFQDFKENLLIHCYDNVKAFYGCNDVITTLLASMKEPEILLPKYQAAILEKYLKPLETYPNGMARFSANEDQKKKYQNAFKKLNAPGDQKKYLNSLAEAFADSHQLHFDAIFDSAIPKLVDEATGKNTEGMIGDLMNTFYIAALDPHTTVQPKELMDDKRDTDSVSYYGVGLLAIKTPTHAWVDDVIPGSPADQGGVQKGDEIIEVDHQNVQKLSLVEYHKAVHKPKGETSHFVFRRGGKNLNIDLVHGEVTSQNIRYLPVKDTHGNLFGYISVRNFLQADVYARINDAIETATKAGAKGLILDVRNNPGGGLETVATTLGLFIGKQEVASVKNIIPQNIGVMPGVPSYVKHLDEIGELLEKSFYADLSQVTSLPMVTLINGGSGSATEIFAGNLQYYQRSWIVGEQSYGKGTVQFPIPFYINGVDTLYFNLTLQEYLLPSGASPQLDGITPDFKIGAYPNLGLKLEVDRESDFVFALPSIGSKWKQNRPTQVAAIQKCLDRTSTARKFYDGQLSNGSMPPDLQLLYAQDVLACELQRK